MVFSPLRNQINSDISYYHYYYYYDCNILSVWTSFQEMKCFFPWGKYHSSRRHVIPESTVPSKGKFFFFFFFFFCFFFLCFFFFFFCFFSLFHFYILFVFFFFFLLFRDAPMAYGSSQARGQIWGTAAWPTPQPQQCRIWKRDSSRLRQILNPISEARDPTCVLMDTSWVC